MVNRSLRRRTAIAAILPLFLALMGAEDSGCSSGLADDPTIKRCRKAPKTTKVPKEGTVVDDQGGKYGSDCRDANYLTVKGRNGKKFTFKVDDMLAENCTKRDNMQWSNWRCR